MVPGGGDLKIVKETESPLNITIRHKDLIIKLDELDNKTGRS